MSTHAAFHDHEPLTGPSRMTRSRRRSTLVSGLVQALIAAVVATNVILWLTDAGALAGVGVGALLGIVAAAAIAWTVPAAERDRPALTRGYRLVHVAGAVLSLAMALTIAGQGLVADLSALDSLIVAAATVASAWLVGLALDSSFGRPLRVVVVGTGEVAQHLVGSLPRGRRGFEVVGLVDDQSLPAPTHEPDAPRLGDLDDIGDLVGRHDVDLVVFSFLGSSDRDLREAVAASRAAGAEVAVVSRLFEGLRGDLSLRRLEGLPVVVAGPSRPSRANAVAQRATDIVLSAGLIILTLPLWAALAIAIRIESRGPVVYKCRRIGQHAQPFNMLKFRKMHDGASGPALTMTEDERFTRMGRFLAHSKMDELPQLWNVLRGQMSFVGPRPEDARYVAAHAETYRSVLSVRPGITGLCQIRYRREFEHLALAGQDYEAYYLETLLPAKLAIDQYYVDHRSWLLNMKIMIWTGIALLRGGELQLSHLAGHVAFRREAPSNARPAEVVEVIEVAEADGLTEVADLTRAA